MHEACGTPAPHRLGGSGTAQPGSGGSGTAQPGPGAGTRPRAPRRASCGPREGDGPGLLHGVPSAAPRPREPRGLRDPLPRAGRWVPSQQPSLGRGGTGRERDPAQKTVGPENTPARTRAARRSWQRAPSPSSAALFYPARNHLVYRKYLFALLVGTGVNYSTCERVVIWIKAAPVFIVWVSC